jgi:hypothetical protein
MCVQIFGAPDQPMYVCTDIRGPRPTNPVTGVKKLGVGAIDLPILSLCVQISGAREQPILSMCVQIFEALEQPLMPHVHMCEDICGPRPTNPM